MKGYFEFESSVLEKDYSIKGFLGMEAMLQYCEDEKVTFDDLMKKFQGVGAESSDVVGLLRFIKKLVFYGYQNYCELNDEQAKFSEKKISLLFDNSQGGIPDLMGKITKAFLEAMPQMDDEKQPNKKK
jgi:hypothetical protein